MTESRIQESIAGHASRNAELLKQLRERGVDVDQRQLVEHHFWAVDQRHASLLAERLSQLDYTILALSPTDHDDGSKVWNLEAGFHRTLAEAASGSVTEQLVRVAVECSSLYDGWGASV